DLSKEEIIYYCPQTIIDIPESDPAFLKLTNVLDNNSIRWALYGQCDVTFHQWGLNHLFDECGHSASEKRIPRWIFELDNSYLLKVLEGIIDSDGDDNGVICTSSKQLQEDIGILMIKCGIYPVFRSRPPRTSKLKSGRIINGNYPEYTVYGYKENHGYRRGKFEKTTCKENKVWCLEMEDNHNFLVFRNGYFTFSGNTSEEFGNDYNDGKLQNEDTLINPKSPYGCSKAAARYIVNTYRKSYNLYAIQGWTFNFESELRGEKYVTKKITQGVARIYHAIKNNQSFKSIELGNLDSYRSWQFCGDVADGIWRQLNQEKYCESKGDWNYIVSRIKQYVMSADSCHTVREFVELAFKYANIKGYWNTDGSGKYEHQMFAMVENDR
ncbi:MAG: GDP-mannose 4,6-dehydratase, partial [Nanoarchaeota archaeon]